MDVSEAIRYKRAVREFQPRPLKPEEMRAILEAGRRAQSSKNTQPWTFLAITRRETLQALSKSGRYAGHLAGAAFAVAILTPDPAEKWSILFDAGHAAATCSWPPGSWASARFSPPCTTPTWPARRWATRPICTCMP